MSEVFYYDAIDIETKKSGASSIFYYENYLENVINLTDAGYYSTSSDVASHLQKYYHDDIEFDNVIVTHNDTDHAGGIRYILENYPVKALWMLRPWLYANELIDRFAKFKSVENLENRLREIYSNLAVLEDLAESKNIPIFEPFQDAMIGKSIVLAPTKSRFLDLVVESEKTPQPSRDSLLSESTLLGRAFESLISFVKAQWGDENFSNDGTTSENEMSVVQFIDIAGDTYLLTGDVGREGLNEALNALEYMYGGRLPNIKLFEVPHHGSRRNLSTELLDRMFGHRLDTSIEKGQENFTAIIHASKLDDEHPKKAVERAIHHRGGKVVVSAGGFLKGNKNKPKRPGWSTAQGRPYPEDQEA